MTYDIIEFNKVIRVLYDYGLAEPDMSPTEYTESRGYSMHSCVHAWTRHVLNEIESNDLAQLAIIYVSLKIPKNTEQKYYTLQRRLLGHAAFCSTTILNGTPVTKGEEWTLKGLGDLFRNMALFQEAEAMYKRALQGEEKALGPAPCISVHCRAERRYLGQTTHQHLILLTI